MQATKMHFGDDPLIDGSSLEETAATLSDPAAVTAIGAGVAEVSRGETVTLQDVRTELAARRNAQ